MFRRGVIDDVSRTYRRVVRQAVSVSVCGTGG